MAIRIAKMSLFHVNSGMVLPSNHSINDRINSNLEARVIEDLVNAPNSVDNPDLTSYLKLEAADNFYPKHIDQTYVITADV